MHVFHTTSTLLVWLSLMIDLASASNVIDIPLQSCKIPSEKVSKEVRDDTIGISFEFSNFPKFNVVPMLAPCMANVAPQRNSRKLPVRIGGSSQDHAYYNASYDGVLENLQVDSSDQSNYFHFGPKYYDFVANYSDNIIMGFNRGGEVQSNVFEAYQKAKNKLGPTLTGIEFGNEPDQFPTGIAIRQHSTTWTPAVDSQSQAEYRVAFENAFGDEDIISAGVFGKNPVQGWGAEELITTNDSALDSIKFFSEHVYPGKRNGLLLTLPDLMNHTNITAFLGPIYDSDRAFANSVGKPYIFGELNSVPRGGSYISSMFGAALWLQDFVFDALIHGFEQFYFHHGPNALYSWFRHEEIESSYYGALFVVDALEGIKRVASLDDNESYIGVFGFYDEHDKLSKISVYNSKFYNSSSSDTRLSETVTLKINKHLKGKRLTAPGAETENALGVSPIFGGQYVANTTCQITGDVVWEEYKPTNGKVTVSVKDSEAILLYVV